MRILLGIIFLLIGIAAGLYVGTYVLFWGGIVTMYEAVMVDQSFWWFVWGIIKFAVSGFFGWGLFWFFTIIAGSCFER